MIFDCVNELKEGLNEMKEIEYLSVREVAKRLGITPARVTTYCKQERFEGAHKIAEFPNSPWRIPEDSLEGLVVERIGRKREKGIKTAVETGMYSFNDFCADKGILPSGSAITLYLNEWKDHGKEYMDFCKAEGFKSEDLTCFLKGAA